MGAIDDLDLTPCFVLKPTPTGWIVRCRKCSAGWIPDRTGAAATESIVEHARQHRIALPLRDSLGASYIGSMAIKIPPDAKVIQDSRLMSLQLIKSLHDRLVNADDGLRDKIKDTMNGKAAAFAESDHVVAALRAGSPRSTIDPRKLYKLIEKGELTVAQFLECVSVKKDPLAQYLSKNRIEQLETPSDAPEPSLATEWKQGIAIDLPKLADSLVAAALAQLMPITNAEAPKPAAQH